ncbi:hypothetical protein EJ08DRAFT_699262 [Tothia fuscella]|uniref:Uncharacterized protein n=1 Tax=Tothia fuscella TaxID=1048955 RepID=A0A9P4NMU7_9PEZI|nr:hypothetical protein EJ08DRAFT_699262 [Tothia fuscella]
MTRPSDWWDACAHGSFSAEDFRNQISTAAASIPNSTYNEKLWQHSMKNRQSFRPFEEWKHETEGGDGDAYGDADIASTTFSTATTSKPDTANSSKSTSTTTQYLERLPWETAEEPIQDATMEDDDLADFGEPTSHELYHESLRGRSTRNNRAPKLGRMMYGMGGSGDQDPIARGNAEKVKSARNAKVLPVGEDRRERKKMYRLTGAFQKVKGLISGNQRNSGL